MGNTALEWVDAKTPHAKVLQNSRASTPQGMQDISDDVRAAVARIQQFQANVLREAVERPLVVVETAGGI